MPLDVSPELTGKAIPELTTLPEGTPAKRHRGRIRPYNMPATPIRTAEHHAAIINDKQARILLAQLQRVQGVMFAGYARTTYYTIPEGERVHVYALAVLMRRAGRHAGRIATVLEERAPWMPEGDRLALIRQAARVTDVDGRIGIRIGLTVAVQRAARAFHLNAVDGMTPEERRQYDGRELRRERRAAKGAHSGQGRGGGRPRKADAMSAAERQRRRRAKLREAVTKTSPKSIDSNIDSGEVFVTSGTAPAADRRAKRQSDPVKDAPAAAMHRLVPITGISAHPGMSRPAPAPQAPMYDSGGTNREHSACCAA